MIDKDERMKLTAMSMFLIDHPTHTFHPWKMLNDAKRPPSGKDRSKIKAARKQNRKRK
jgi:hypothetical protein